jgi:hypothetical protein
MQFKKTDDGFIRFLVSFYNKDKKRTQDVLLFTMPASDVETPYAKLPETVLKKGFGQVNVKKAIEIAIADYVPSEDLSKKTEVFFAEVETYVANKAAEHTQKSKDRTPVYVKHLLESTLEHITKNGDTLTAGDADIMFKTMTDIRNKMREIGFKETRKKQKIEENQSENEGA